MEDPPYVQRMSTFLVPTPFYALASNATPHPTKKKRKRKKEAKEASTSSTH